MTTKNKSIDLNIKNNIGTITIDRQKKMNALNEESNRQFIHAFDNFIDDENIRVIVITGAGDNGFM